MRASPGFVQRPLFVIAVATAVICGFYYYSLLRGMFENVGFHVPMSLFAFAYTVIFLFGLSCVFAIVPAFVATRQTVRVTSILVWSLSAMLIVGTCLFLTMRALTNSARLSFYGGGFLFAAVALPFVWTNSRAITGTPGRARRAVVVLAAATAMGGAVGEVFMLADERAFRRAIETNVDRPFTRARAWPASNCALIYEPARGVWATD